jgi:predicted Zn-ribbon and HTH transcriptional regulator
MPYIVAIDYTALHQLNELQRMSGKRNHENVVIKCARCQSHLDTEEIHNDNEDAVILVSECKTCKSERGLEEIEQRISLEY